MEKYIFILGRDPELSKQEILCYLKARKIKFEIQESSDIAMLIDLETINPQQMIQDLGGTQKIGRIIASFDNLYLGTKNKVRYAISLYSEEDEDLKEKLKAYFKKERIKATIKKSHREQDFLDPSEAQNLIEIIQYKGYIAKTLAVFNSKEYKKRDTKRPAQRPLHTISIRLAKIMINLSGAKPGDTLLDPFSGIGTVLQEAMLMGINVIGVDKEESCIEASQKNLEWLKKEYKVKTNYRLLNLDARQLAKFIRRADVVVTEPYLGPFIKKYLSPEQAQRLTKELYLLYAEVLHQLKSCEPRAIVFITPIFPTAAKTKLRVNIEPLLQKMKMDYEPPMIYATPTSKITREIWVMRKR